MTKNVLSHRATQWLNQHPRLPAVPTSQVVELLQQRGVPAFDAWLDFHERYAGYEIQVAETCVLGLVQAQPQWLDPMRPRIFDWSRENKWGVACADIHPSYDFTLRHDGFFLGGPSQTFDIFIEQQSVIAEFCAEGPFENILLTRIQEPGFRAQVLARTSLQPIEPASDASAQFYRDDMYLLVDDRDNQQLRDGWVRLARRS